MKARWTGVAAAIFALALTAAPASARGIHHGGDSLGIPIGLILHSANLTSAQRSQIHSIMKSQWSTLKPLVQQLHQGRQAVATAYLAGSDPTSQVTANEAIQAQINAARLSTLTQIRAVLTSAQLSQASSTYTQIQSLRSQIHSLLHQNSSTSSSSSSSSSSDQ